MVEKHQKGVENENKWKTTVKQTNKRTNKTNNKATAKICLKNKQKQVTKKKKNRRYDNIYIYTYIVSVCSCFNKHNFRVEEKTIFFLSPEVSYHFQGGWRSMCLTCFLLWAQEKLNRGSGDFCFYFLAREQSVTTWPKVREEKQQRKQNSCLISMGSKFKYVAGRIPTQSK